MELFSNLLLEGPSENIAAVFTDEGYKNFINENVASIYG